MRARSTPPLWFSLCVAALLAGVLRAFSQAPAGVDTGGGHALDLQLAWFGFLIPIISAIWSGLQVVAKVTLAALSWSVKALWFFATTTANGLKALGGLVARGVKEVWEFFEATYDQVLKPAWMKFWRWFDKLRRWLDETFGPVLEWLRDVRDQLLAFWKTYVRPWLDLIDVTRKVLRVLGSLGIGWARRLDAQLAALQDAIERPFRLLLAKVNEVINVVNRIVDMNGLLQRLTLVRSALRDAGLIIHGFANARSRPLSAGERDAMGFGRARRTVADVVVDKREYFATGGGRSAPLIDEMVLVARRALNQ